MKKIALGALFVGVAALGYMVRKMEDEGKFDSACNSANEFGNKAKKKLMDAMDAGKDQAEYLSDRAKAELNKGKRKLDGLLG